MHWSIVFIVLSIVHIGTVSGVCSIPDIDVCQFISCGNGTCIRDNSTDQCYRCQCDVGYSGLNCETEINIGNNNCGDPCQNGGHCESKGENAFACVCPADFIGVHCEVSVIATHVCIQAPEAACQNGGVCTINGNDFLCRCAIGWTGRNCETAISTITPPTGSTTCPTNPCANGAICLMTDNGFMCSCPPTYTGLLCDVPISSTTFSTTEPTTTNVLISTTTSGPGQSNSCASRPCLNDATCYNTGNSFFCFCKKGFSGPTCALQTPSTTAGPVTVPTTSPCASNPCNNGGSCYKFNDSFVCACTTYYTGDTCDQPKVFTTPASTTASSAITCANGPCQNGGTCYSTGNSYFCFCGSNSMYTGKNCEQPKPTADATCPLDCSPGYCIRTGATENAYACMCNGALTPSSCRK